MAAVPRTNPSLPQAALAALALTNVGFATFRTCSHDAVTRVYHDAGKHEHTDDFKEWRVGGKSVLEMKKRSPARVTAEMKRQFQLALLRLSAMISQYFHAHLNVMDVFCNHEARSQAESAEGFIYPVIAQVTAPILTFVPLDFFGT